MAASRKTAPALCTQHADLNLNNIRLYIPLSLVTSGSTLLFLINRKCPRPCLYSEVGSPGLKGATRASRKQKLRHLGVYSPRSTFYPLGDAFVRVALTCAWADHGGGLTCYPSGNIEVLTVGKLWKCCHLKSTVR
jgi:hypothetical protein